MNAAITIMTNSCLGVIGKYTFEELFRTLKHNQSINEFGLPRNNDEFPASMQYLYF